MHQHRVQNPKLNPVKGLLVVIGLVAAVMLDSYLAQLLTAFVSELVAAVAFWGVGVLIALYALRRFVLAYSYQLSASLLRVSHAYGRYERLIEDVYLNTVVAAGSPEELTRRYSDARVHRAVMKGCGLETFAIAYRSDGRTQLFVLQPDEKIREALIAAAKRN